ncbi:Non-repetitive/WGA-negative nucleoporin C-terminal-domain-containing protein, partial [Cantharellus anzutake]|uniref:Non-repetitive/WGA-negative nucleoporin C-terminal-domain-containing protein n=1 Tax=Cantharellus anzutake TaxID=1750568 RepID=UPI001904AD9C
MFPNPPSLSDNARGSNSVLPTFISHGEGKEPGLLLCSPNGELRYWGRVSMGITGAERFQSFHMSLASSEFVVIMRRMEVSVLVGTNLGRLFRVSVSALGGVSQMNATLLSGAHGVLSRVASSLFGSTAFPHPIRQIVSLASQQDAGPNSYLWALTRTHLQKWSISSSNWEELQLNVDLAPLIHNELLRQISGAAVGDFGLRLLDLSLGIDEVFVLFSFIERQDLGKGAGTARCHAIARLSALGEAVTMKSLHAIPHDAMPPEHDLPRMCLLEDGNTLVLRFHDGLIIQSLAGESSFQSTIILKDPWDRLLDLDVTRKEDPSTAELIMMTRKHDLLVCQIDLDKVRRSTPETPANHLRSILEQGVFFGSMDENPFQTHLGLYTSEVLAVAAESLSRDILNSNLSLLRHSTDLRVHLAERKQALENLAAFLNRNSAMSQLPQASRQRLAIDAEKLFVAEDLWVVLNDRTDGGLLAEAISNIINSKMLQSTSDSVRLIFRHHAGEIETIFEELQRMGQRAASNDASTRHPTGVIEESCAIMIRMWASAVRYRQQTQSVYEIVSSKIIIPPWTSLPSQIRASQYFFELIVRWIKDRSNGQGDIDAPAGPLESLGLVLREMGSMVLTMWQERYDYLASNAIDEEGQSVLETFKTHFASVRKQILSALVQWGSVDTAYRLAEEYRDLGFLASLCNNPIYGDSAKASMLLQRHHGAFAIHLFNWYIENGQLRKLLEIDSQFIPLLEAYLRTNHHPRIQWIHDLGVGRFDAAASALEAESQVELRRETKHVILSIAKLSTLALMDDPDSDGAQHALQFVNTQLDLVSIHDRVIMEFLTVLSEERHKSPETMADAVTRTYGTTMTQYYPGYVSVFKALVKDLCQGQALSEEQLVEILTLRDHFEVSEDFVQAFQIAAISKGRHQPQLHTAIQSINRRLFISSDWVDIAAPSNKTDIEIDDRLRRTPLYQTLRSLSTKGREDLISLCLSPGEV